MTGKNRPKALFVQPPIYDFALFDLFLKPFGMLRVARWLAGGGWDAAFVNGLDSEDPVSSAVLGRPKRTADGTGKFHRLVVDAPPEARLPFRRFARYGIVAAELERRIAAGGKEAPPDIVFVETGMTYWYLGVEETARLCRRLFPRTPLVVGGTYASLLPDHCARRTGADLVVKGDAEGPLSAFLAARGLPVPVQGFPAFPLREKTFFRGAGVLRLNEGCPFSCDYCASRRLAPKFRPGDPEALFEELAALYGDCGTRSFGFFDDALLEDKERRFLPFLELVIARFGPAGRRSPGAGPRFFLPNAVHVRHIDDDTARLMADAGFREIRLGFESVSSGFHDRHGGKYPKEAFPRAVESLAKAGFPRKAVGVYIIAGLPGQRCGEVEESVRYALDTGLRVHLAEYSPVPGSRLWKESAANCRYPLEEEPLFHNNTFFPMEWEGFRREDLERLKSLVRERR